MRLIALSSEADVTTPRALPFRVEERSAARWHRHSDTEAYLKIRRNISKQRCSSVAPEESNAVTYKCRFAQKTDSSCGVVHVL